MKGKLDHADAALLFTEVLDCRWEAGVLRFESRSGDYVRTTYMSRRFAMQVHHALGEMLAQTGDVVEFTGKKRKRKG